MFNLQSISLEDIPAALADLWGITVASAQILLSIIVILAVLLPTMYLAKKSNAVMMEIIMVFITICFLVGIGWIPFWILIAIVSVMAIAWAFLGSKVVVGGN